MKREQKIINRKERAKNHRKKRKDAYITKIRAANEIGPNIPLYAVDKYGYSNGSWPDSNSPTGYSQKCSYEAYGICQSPCNGDC